MTRRLYVPAFNVWALPDYLRAAILPGQWVRAGEGGPLGRYLGQTRGGSDVVAWQGNAKGRGPSYGAALRAYAKGDSARMAQEVAALRSARSARRAARVAQ